MRDSTVTTAELQVQLGQCSTAAAGHVNQDRMAARTVAAPHERAERRAKGVALAIADGIGSSDVSGEAADTAVRGFIADYYCTSAAWSVGQSVQRVLAATNSWLYAQTMRSRYYQDMNRGYVCTFSALVIKASTAHLFHVGDTRIYRWAGRSLECLTHDHRIELGQGAHHLARALGVGERLEIDYQRVPVEAGDVFVMATDGAYEFWSPTTVSSLLDELAHDPQAAADRIVAHAMAQGSADDASVQIAVIERVGASDTSDLAVRASDSALTGELSPRQSFAGYEIIRVLHESSRSRVYLARAQVDDSQAVIKIPGSDLASDAELLDRFLLEAWVARRLDNVHVAKALAPQDTNAPLHVAFEYVPGQSLAHWLRDNPRPSLRQVRAIAEQIACGLLAFHRQEMIHQDLRPANVLIDDTATVKIIDFGAVRVAGIAERGVTNAGVPVLGTHQYSAPEYFMGDVPSPAADLFSLGVIVYQMLTGDLPYGAGVARATTRAARNHLAYSSITSRNPDVPDWVDAAVRRAVHPDPARRQADVAEFIHELSHAPRGWRGGLNRPLIERHPLRFWQGVSALLALALSAVLVWIGLGRVGL